MSTLIGAPSCTRSSSGRARSRTSSPPSMPYASSGITTLYEVTPEEVVHDTSVLTSLVHPDDRAAVLESFARSARTLTPREAEYRVRTASGVEKWVFGRGVPEREPDG